MSKPERIDCGDPDFGKGTGVERKCLMAWIEEYVRMARAGAARKKRGRLLSSQ